MPVDIAKAYFEIQQLREEVRKAERACIAFARPAGRPLGRVSPYEPQPTGPPAGAQAADGIGPRVRHANAYRTRANHDRNELATGVKNNCPRTNQSAAIASRSTGLELLLWAGSGPRSSASAIASEPSIASLLDEPAKSLENAKHPGASPAGVGLNPRRAAELLPCFI
jgi:hypothetical protein